MKFFHRAVPKLKRVLFQCGALGDDQLSMSIEGSAMEFHYLEKCCLGLGS